MDYALASFDGFHFHHIAARDEANRIKAIKNRYREYYWTNRVDNRGYRR